MRPLTSLVALALVAGAAAFGGIHYGQPPAKPHAAKSCASTSLATADATFSLVAIPRKALTSLAAGTSPAAGTIQATTKALASARRSYATFDALPKCPALLNEPRVWPLAMAASSLKDALDDVASATKAATAHSPSAKRLAADALTSLSVWDMWSKAYLAS
jgi:hypothetical protein